MVQHPNQSYDIKKLAVTDKITYAAGVDEVNNEHLTLQEALSDNTRIEFYRQHLFYIQRSIK
jgi:beta-glucosidase/6-phospho-beta-glucosidase/beta-galactosidase